MLNFGQIITEQTDTILNVWIESVRRDRHLKSDDTLSPTAIKDHLPMVLEALATVLSRSEDDDLQLLVDASLQHGTLRAQQGFDPVEIVREYRLLRRALFATLEADLLRESAIEVYRVFRLIDMVIDEAIAQCFKSYVGERMKELEQLQRQLAMTGQEMNRLVRTNQDGLSLLTDELNVRLNTIVGFSELFLRQQQKQQALPQDTVPKIDHIERVVRNGRYLLHLINDLNELSRYKAGKLKLHLMTTNVRAIVQEIVQVMTPTIAAKELQVSVDCATAPDQVLSDPLRLHQIITNLLHNAIRYTNTGSIQLHAQSLPEDRWSIAVIDTGVGIAPEDQANIFEPQFQLETSDQSRDFDSKGLGLASASRLVNLLQGEITVTSTLGVGSIFTVTFPLHVTLAEAHTTDGAIE
ncbi:sensor histidine kinase [Stenomitos frigidus ULC18]|uniref:histidine kinase n=2 Tax=Stenomitos TaxID=1844270 RepID=A0A2T1DZ35_9CYAN|nr:sensor histidine kinase [Stenomitos frigidus ULC18]